MHVLLFLDESGTDHGIMPYEVIGGVAIPEQQLWPFVQDAEWLQEDSFGGVLKQLLPGKEFKATGLLARDKFRFAGQAEAFRRSERRVLARRFLTRGRTGQAPRRDEFTAYGQACLHYVEELLRLCLIHGVKVFACIVHPDAPLTENTWALRRDIAFLFERYFYYLEDLGNDQRGLLVFDELERAQCRRLMQRMQGYFLRTETGRERSSLIIPEPFFVHSDLTMGVQVADIVVYVINWAYRYGEMTERVRDELRTYAGLVEKLVYKAERPDPRGGDGTWDIWSIKYLDDLRTRREREDNCK
jgi:hypothetical protein